MKRLWLLSGLLCLLTACGSKDPTADLTVYVNRLQKQTPPATSLLAAFHFRAANHFNGQLAHSPFPQTSDSVNSALLAKPPLERYPIDVLHLLGIVLQGAKTFAVIQTPDLKIFQVQQGDLMGNHFGRITLITAYSLSLIEPADPTSGLANPQTITLHLKAS